MKSIELYSVQLSISHELSNTAHNAVRVMRRRERIGICDIIMVSDTCADMVLVTLHRVAADELADESCHEQLCAKHHHDKRDVKVRHIRHERAGETLTETIQFCPTYGNQGYESNHEHQSADEAEDMHGLETESADEPQREQVKVSVDEAVPAHKLAFAILACLMVYRFLAYAREARFFSQIRDVAMHLAVHFDILDHLTAIGF